MLPIVVIAGRPNVGKSTLFNRLAGRRLALVADTPGVTRDRKEAEAQLRGRMVRLIDTAGLEEAAPGTLAGRMGAGSASAIAQADLVVFVVDARSGVTSADEHFTQWLRRQGKPVLLVANKAEGRSATSSILEAYSLGLGDPIGVSAEHGEGIADLMAEIADRLPSETTTDEGPDDRPLKLAIVGRPNAGKSTLVNRMIGEDRMITGPEAGITRDSISLRWQWQGRPVQLVDTAGLRKRAKVEDKLERLSAADAGRAIDFAEVVVLLLDATRGLEAQDLRIANQAIEEGRALIIAVNKWDVAENASALFNGIKAALDEGLAQLKDVPLLTVSAKTGKGIDTILKVAFELREQWSRRVPTGELNRWFERAIEANPPPAPKGKQIKLRYITQVNTRPPSFAVFGNRTDELPESYRRYLVNALRRELSLGAIPLRLNFRGRSNPFDRKRR
jgi:GTPase